MLLDPPGRSSLWRLGVDGAPINVNDNALNCGNYTTQWSLNGGKCGECGDAWNEERPRQNDEGGLYGRGIIGQTYTAGQVVRMTVQITANHLGYFIFKLCPKQSAGELVTQECLNSHNLTVINGDNTGLRFLVDQEDPNQMFFYPVVQLPEDVNCENCVIQWTYVTGNSWGNCQPTPAGFLCGQQEWFVNCADVRILPAQRFNRRR